MRDADSTSETPRTTYEIAPRKGFALTLTYGTVGVYATAKGPNGVTWVSAVYRDPEVAIFHAWNLIDAYLLGRERAGLPPIGEEMPGLLARMVADLDSDGGGAQ